MTLNVRERVGDITHEQLRRLKGQVDRRASTGAPSDDAEVIELGQEGRRPCRVRAGDLGTDSEEPPQDTSLVGGETTRLSDASGASRHAYTLPPNSPLNYS